MTMITEAELDQINAKRVREGKRKLSMVEARKIATERRKESTRTESNDDGFSMIDYLVGQGTGVSYNFSSAVGSMSHSNNHTSSTDSSSGWGGGSGGGDSGGGSSGGDGGGGGGGE